MDGENNYAAAPLDDRRNLQVDNAIRAIRNKKPPPEIDFTIHTMEDGTQVSTLERVVKGTSEDSVVFFFPPKFLPMRHANSQSPIDVQAPAMYKPTDEQFWQDPETKTLPNIQFLKQHFYREGRLTEEQLHAFRREVSLKGISSYPHPWLMPTFWQFPTVSMGLGPIMGIYQARFMKYLHDRGLADTAKRKVWVFCGDGEMDEPEAKGAIGLAGRERLELAIAYLDLGDVETARTLLNEVVAGADPAAREEAAQLLREIG